MEYTAKYYPLVNGKPEERVTTVRAADKKTAETAVRDAFIKQMENYLHMIETFNMITVGGSVEDIKQNLEYAKEEMIIKIL